MVVNETTSKTLTAAQRLGRAMKAARTERHMTCSQLATAIGISESACRRLENGTSKNARGETLMMVLAWAGSRGMREFADWKIEPKPRWTGPTDVLRDQRRLM